VMWSPWWRDSLWVLPVGQIRCRYTK